MNTFGKEKRKFVRRRCAIPTEFFVQGRGYLGCIKNERLSGVFIETRWSFSVGQQVRVTFTIPQGMDQKKTGDIAAIQPEGVGIRFLWPGYNR